MKRSLLLPCLALSLLFPSCATISTGDGPSASAADIQKGVTPVRDITFSIDFQDDYGPESWFDKKDFILAIRKDFEKSGLFSRVHYVLPQNAGPYHLHFRIGSSGTDMNTRMTLGALSGLCFCTLPVWTTYALDWSMSVVHRGKELYAFSSQQEGKDIIWAPFILASPFMNHATTGNRMVHAATHYFLTEIQQNRINEVIPVE